MNNQTLVIYDFKILYQILKEVEHHLNFSLISIEKSMIKELDKIKNQNFLIISNKKIKDSNEYIYINQLPINLIKIVESINIRFLKKKFNQQSHIDLGKYSLNLNSRIIHKDQISLDLTEREADIIIFLKNSKKPIKIGKLQTEVWGHNSKLETHTVETHIYRLRKKISNTFNDNNFIKSSKSGYKI